MLEVNIKADIRRATAKLNATQRRVVPTAARQALNRTAKSALTQAVRTASRETGIKQKTVREYIKIARLANKQLLLAVITARGKRKLNIIGFVSKSKRRVGAFKKQKGVKAKVAGRQVVFPGSFIRPVGNSGKLIVAKRVGKKRIPTQGVYVDAALPSFLTGKPARIAAITKAKERWPIEFERALNNQLRRLKR